MEKPEFVQEMIDCKRGRRLFKKKQLNSTINIHRLERIFDIFQRKSELFNMLGESEKIDFLLFYLEKYVNASPTFQKEVAECEYEPTEQVLARRLQTKDRRFL